MSEIKPEDRKIHFEFDVMLPELVKSIWTGGIKYFNEPLRWCNHWRGLSSAGVET